MSRIWWIDEDRVAGSPNPTPEELRRLRAAGFRAIVSLLDEAQQPPHYHRHEAEQLGYRRESIPMRDGSAPSLAQIHEFLRLVAARLEHGKVLVHCQGGLGRTGTMGAAYWIAKGLTAEDAVSKVRAACRHAVENPEQRRALDALETDLRGRRGETDN